MKKLLLILMIFVSSCLDMFTDKEIQICNKVYLTRQGNGATEYSFSLKFAPNSFMNIVDEDILELRGDSSSFYILSFRQDTNFYFIRHRRGDTILSIKSINRNSFQQATLNKKFIFNYKAH